MEQKVSALPAAGLVDPELRRAGLSALAAAFGSLGRGVLCLDRNFRVRHASPEVAALLSDQDAPAGDAPAPDGGGTTALIGRTVSELLGERTFGPGSALRTALEAGERREGWRAYLATGGDQGRLVSLSAAPLAHPDSQACDPEVTYLVILRPEEDAVAEDDRGPTVLSGMVARSASMRRVFHLVHSLRHSEATVLITGESGTGKEVLARAIHETSPRRHGPFVAVNCAALPRELLESELFGHVRGAFTGAVRDRVGRFEAAAEGTLFLDEVAEMAPESQAKLLRVLQEHRFERVGDSVSRPSRARILAATNRDLRSAVLAGDLREDLYYRLRVVPIELPPLRERREDVEPIARWLLSRIGRREERAVRPSASTMRALLTYPWPGNVRELENALEYAMATSRGQTLLADHLPVEVQSGQPLVSLRREASAAETLLQRAAAGGDAATEDAAAEPPEPPERRRLRQALDAHRWRRGPTADALGVSRTTLWRKMREHGLLE